MSRICFANWVRQESELFNLFLSNKVSNSKKWVSKYFWKSFEIFSHTWNGVLSCTYIIWQELQQAVFVWKWPEEVACIFSPRRKCCVLARLIQYDEQFREHRDVNPMNVWGFGLSEFFFMEDVKNICGVKEKLDSVLWTIYGT